MSDSKPPSSQGKFGEWTVSIKFGLLGLGAVIIATATFALWKSQREVIAFAAAAAVGAGAVGSTYYASATLRQTAALQSEAASLALQAATQAAERERTAAARQRIAASLRIMERLNDPLFARTRRRWRIERTKIKSESLDQTIKRLDADVDSRSAVQDMLNVLEEMALAVHNDAVDEKVLREYSETLVLDTYGVLRGWIERRQMETRKGWVQLKKLDEKWGS